MIKKILVILLILFTLLGILTVAVIYLNKKYIPVKLKSLIVEGLASRTRKQVSLGSLKFNLFKGLVLNDLAIRDGDKTIISAKEAACTFFIWPFFKKQIVIPSVTIRSATAYIERREDNTLNIVELFSPKQAAVAKGSPGFNIVISNVNIISSKVNFQDNTVAPVFNKDIEGINLNLNLSLPAAVKFNLKANMPSKNSSLKLAASGKYKIFQKQLSAKIKIDDLSPADFVGYYQRYGILLAQGVLDAEAAVSLKNDLLDIDLEADSEQLKLLVGFVGCAFKGNVNADFQYGLKSRSLNYSGELNIVNAGFSGVPSIGSIKNISGVMGFNNSGISSDKLKADVFDLPVEAKLRLSGLTEKPFLNVSLSASPELEQAKIILSERFKIAIPADVQGDSRLVLNLESGLGSKEKMKVSGTLEISRASLKFEKIKEPFEEINAKFIFDSEELSWQKLNFKFAGVDYASNGTLNNYQSPLTAVTLEGGSFFLKSAFTLQNKVISFNEFRGKYFNSDFDIFGSIDFTDQAHLQAEINGNLGIDLVDLAKILKDHKEQLEKIELQGKTRAKFILAGDPANLKLCALKADFSGPSISAYGLKAGDFSLAYAQENGIADILGLHLSLYEGILDMQARVNLNSLNMPLLVNAAIQGVKIEKLKLDTPVKDKDISGIIQAQLKLDGFLDNFSRTKGSGEILISEGRLWQLDLFKGMGKLLFTSDFSAIVFHQASCNFFLADQHISSDNLKLKSNLVDITGSGRVGFDSTIDVTLNARVAGDLPLSGSVKDIASVVLSQAEKFGVIRITGTLKEPKYNFQTSVIDIMDSIKNIFWKNQ